MVITGEDIPRGHSARARAVIVEVGPGDVDLERLGAAQAAARQGTFAAATAGYLCWLAPRMDELRAQLPAEVARWRSELTAAGMHARTPEAVAHLAAAWRLWLRFATDIGACDRAEAERIWRRVVAALRAATVGQRDHHQDEDPARRFVALLSGTLQSGGAHVTAPDADYPPHPAVWGWRLRQTGTGAFEREEWQPQGPWIGWIDGDDLYLEPDASYAAANRLGTAIGTPITVQPKTLHKRLQATGLLASTEQANGRGQTVRPSFGGDRRPYLHLSADALAPGDDPAAQRDPGQSDPGHRDPTGADGPVGPIGRVLDAEVASAQHHGGEGVAEVADEPGPEWTRWVEL